MIAVYHRFGQTFGSSRNEEEVKQRFKTARRKLFAVDTSAADQVEGELVSSDTIERDLWRGFIDFVFDDVSDAPGLFETLWEFFALPQNWRVYSDVDECLNRWKQQGHYVAIASNFDSRLIPIVDAFPELAAFDDVFCSAMMGFRKPDPAFYAEVWRRVNQTLGTEVSGSDIVFAGDCIENDFHGPRRAGWSAFWLDRTGEIGSAVNCPPSRRIVSLEQISTALA